MMSKKQRREACDNWKSKFEIIEQARTLRKASNAGGDKEKVDSDKKGAEKSEQFDIIVKTPIPNAKKTQSENEVVPTSTGAGKPVRVQENNKLAETFTGAGKPVRSHDLFPQEILLPAMPVRKPTQEDHREK